MQQSYTTTRLRGFPGQREGFSTHRSSTFINDVGATPKIVDVAIAATYVAQSQIFTLPADPDNSVSYTVTINGVACTTTALDSDSTRAELQAALVIAINNAVGTAVTAANSGNDVIVTSDAPGTPFTYSIDTSTTADITAGTAVENTGTGTVYTFTLNGVTVTYTAIAGDGAKQIRDGLIKAFNDTGEFEGIVYATASGNNVRLTANTAGTDFTYADTDSRLTGTTTQANVATQPIKFGKAVVKRTGSGTTDLSCMLPTAASQIFLGLVERDMTIADDTGMAAKACQTLSIGHEGEWVVEVEHAVAVGDPVYFRHTAGAGEEAGSWRMDADTADADLVANARYRTSTTGRGLAVLALNRP